MSLLSRSQGGERREVLRESRGERIGAPPLLSTSGSQLCQSCSETFGTRPWARASRSAEPQEVRGVRSVRGSPKERPGKESREWRTAVRLCSCARQIGRRGDHTRRGDRHGANDQLSRRQLVTFDFREVARAIAVHSPGRRVATRGSIQSSATPSQRAGAFLAPQPAGTLNALWPLLITRSL